MNKYLAILFLLTVSLNIQAQQIFQESENKDAIELGIAIDPTSVSTLSYSRLMNLGYRKIEPFAKIKIPYRMNIFDNYDVQMGFQILLADLFVFGLLYEPSLKAGKVTTRNFESIRIASRHKIMWAYYRDRFYFGLTTHAEINHSNKIEHSDYYRANIYPEAIDGWYKGSGGNIQSGIELGYTFKDKIRVRMDFRIPKSLKRESFNGSPAHVGAGVAYRF
jgi:hypothetical protein